MVMAGGFTTASASSMTTRKSARRNKEVRRSHWCDRKFREGWEGFWSKHMLDQDFAQTGSPISTVTVKHL